MKTKLVLLWLFLWIGLGSAQLFALFPPKIQAQETEQEKQQKADIVRCQQIMKTLIFLYENGYEDEVIVRYMSPLIKEKYQKIDPNWRATMKKLDAKRDKDDKAKQVKEFVKLIEHCYEQEPEISEPLTKRAESHISFCATKQFNHPILPVCMNFHKVDGIWYWIGN